MRGKNTTGLSSCRWRLARRFPLPALSRLFSARAFLEPAFLAFQSSEQNSCQWWIRRRGPRAKCQADRTSRKSYKQVKDAAQVRGKRSATNSKPERGQVVETDSTPRNEFAMPWAEPSLMLLSSNNPCRRGLQRSTLYVLLVLLSYTLLVLLSYTRYRHTMTYLPIQHCTSHQRF